MEASVESILGRKRNDMHGSTGGLGGLQGSLVRRPQVQPGQSGRSTLAGHPSRVPVRLRGTRSPVLNILSLHDTKFVKTLEYLQVDNSPLEVCSVCLFTARPVRGGRYKPLPTKPHPVSIFNYRRFCSAGRLSGTVHFQTTHGQALS